MPGIKWNAIIIFLIIISSYNSFAKQPHYYFTESNLSNDTLTFLQKSPVSNAIRIRTLNYSILGMYGLSMSWLYSQWYENYSRSSFHFFNDNKEWELMDKYGHFWDAYNIAKPLMHCYSWGGYDKNKALLYGVGIAFLFQTTVEIFDGFSSQWGFSNADMLANVGGLALFAGQQLFWNEQRMVLKYSFHQTQYSKYNSKLLGNSLPENILKDYNGLTYWLSINPKSFLKTSFFPQWISLSLGYGAEGMTGGESNPLDVDGKKIPSFERHRQYYLAIDFDLARIKTKSQILNSVFKLINIIHLPAPAIEWSPGRKPVYWGFYF